MKVIACIKLFNEEDYISECLYGIYPYVDKIIILESCFGAMGRIVRADRMRAPGLSGDGTLDKVKAFDDYAGKIEYREVGFINGDQTILYNEFVGSADVGDYLWMVDADEVYQSDLCDWIRVQIDDERYHAFWLSSKLFWHSFSHRRTEPGWCRSHQRIYMKVDESAHYVERNLDVRWKDDAGNVYGFGKPPKATHYRGRNYRTFVGELDIHAYNHYAYVRTPQRMLEKVVSQYLQNEEPLRDSEYRHCQQYRDAIEFKIMTHPWFTCLDLEDVEPYHREHHPVWMKDNPWYHEQWNQLRSTIGYEEACAMLASGGLHG